MSTIKAGLDLRACVLCLCNCGTIASPTISDSGLSTLAGLPTPAQTACPVLLQTTMIITFLVMCFPPYSLVFLFTLTLTFLPPASIIICLGIPPFYRTRVRSLSMLSLYLGLVICTFSLPLFSWIKFWSNLYMIIASLVS